MQQCDTETERGTEVKKGKGHFEHLFDTNSRQRMCYNDSVKCNAIAR